MVVSVSYEINHAVCPHHTAWKCEPTGGSWFWFFKGKSIYLQLGLLPTGPNRNVRVGSLYHFLQNERYRNFTVLLLIIHATQISMISLKGPKLEIFVDGIFTQIRPVWVGELGTRPKIQKVNVWGLILPFISWDFCFSDVGDITNKFFYELRWN